MKFCVFDDYYLNLKKIQRSIENLHYTFKWVDQDGNIRDGKDIPQENIPFTNTFSDAVNKNIRELSKQDYVFLIDLALTKKESAQVGKYEDDSPRSSFKAIVASNIISLIFNENPNAKVKVISAINDLKREDKWKSLLDLIRNEPWFSRISFIPTSTVCNVDINELGKKELLNDL